MAVVFISPRQRQKVLLMGIAVGLLIFLIVLFSFIFFSKPKEIPPELVFNKPKVAINMSVFDSDQFKGLIPFVEMQMQFEYKAYDKDKKETAGYISAVSLEEARSFLTASGLTIIYIQESAVGRLNPFEPYYQSVPAPIINQNKNSKK